MGAGPRPTKGLQICTTECLSQCLLKMCLPSTVWDRGADDAGRRAEWEWGGGGRWGEEGLEVHATYTHLKSTSILTDTVNWIEWAIKDMDEDDRNVPAIWCAFYACIECGMEGTVSVPIDVKEDRGAE